MQIAPAIGVGTGIAGVASNLDREFRAMGHTVESFTFTTALRGRHQRPFPKTTFFRVFALFRRMVWFTTVGSLRAREFLAERPDAVSICHDNAMVGDVYVNHGVVGAAMRARGNGVWRMVRNPTHPFTFLRDLIRYRSGIHQAVVALSPSEADTLRQIYGRVRPPIVVIPNGVDLDRFHPPTPEERRKAREAFHLDDDARVMLFIGHEFARKGLDFAIDALEHAPTVLLLVVGGNAQAIDASRARATERGVADRVLFVATRWDIPFMFAASDCFILPSAYEANALVVLEALASGLPVLATPVGFAPEVVQDGVNGYLISRDAREIADRMEQIAADEPGTWSERARASVEDYGWAATARKYVELLESLRAQRDAEIA